MGCTGNDLLRKSGKKAVVASRKRRERAEVGYTRLFRSPCRANAVLRIPAVYSPPAFTLQIKKTVYPAIYSNLKHE